MDLAESLVSEPSNEAAARSAISRAYDAPLDWVETILFAPEYLSTVAATRTCRFETNFGTRVNPSHSTSSGFRFGCSTTWTTISRSLMVLDRQPSL